MRRTLALSVFGLAVLAAPRAYGFCIEKPTDQEGNTYDKVAWSLKPIIFRIHDTGSGTMDKNAEFDAVRAAFAEWAAVDCADIQFTEGQLIPASDPVNIHHNAQGEIRVFWARDEIEWDSQNTAPIAKTWYNFDVSGNIVSAGILLNAINKVWSDASGGETNKFDVQSVMATEIGRVLGLAASQDSSAVMYPSFAIANTDKRTLKEDDINAARYLYPADTSGEDGGACPQAVEPDTTCPQSSQYDGGTTQSDGGGSQQDGSVNPQTDGGGQDDGGVQHCTANEQCESGICQIDGTCAPVKEDSGGCGCRAAAGGGVLGLALFGLALGLALKRRRR